MNILASFPSPAIKSISLGPINIAFYALCIVVGIICAYLVIRYRANQRDISLEFIDNLFFWVLISGIICARIFHVLTTWPDYFGPNKDWTEVFAIWHGGIAIYGGILGGLLAIFICCRVQKVSIRLTLDCVAPAVILAQGIGRLGNYFNQELFGLPTTLPWAVEIDEDIVARTYCYEDVFCETDILTFHPVFLYEMIWNILGFFLLLYIDKKFHQKLQTGQLFTFYIMFYSFGRIFFEMIRINYSTYILGLRINVWSSICAFICGFLLFVYFQNTKNKNSKYNEPSQTHTPFESA